MIKRVCYVDEGIEMGMCVQTAEREVNARDNDNICMYSH